MAQIKFKTHLKCILLASILLSGCQTAFEEDQTRRSKITQFALNHPVAAQAIGMEDTGSFNISSNATRFAYRSGLDDTANGDGKGTQVNAVRQALWQAAITSQFDNVIAEEAGNAYLADIKIREGKINYFSRYLADQAVDQRNNRIGRSIGSGRPNTDMKALAESVLLYYHKIGLWTASETRTNGRKVWRITQEKLSPTAYREAMKNIEPLDAEGLREEERNMPKPDKIDSISKTVKAIRKVKG